MSFNFTAAVPVRSDFGAKEKEISHCFYFFPFYLLLNLMGSMLVCDSLSTCGVNFLFPLLQ